MPGFTGIIGKKAEEKLPELMKAGQHLIYHDWNTASGPFVTRDFMLKLIRSHGSETGIHEDIAGGVQAWVDGELYNGDIFQDMFENMNHYEQLFLNELS